MTNDQFLSYTARKEESIVNNNEENAEQFYRLENTSICYKESITLITIQTMNSWQTNHNTTSSK
jgi:hypothetical protein